MFRPKTKPQKTRFELLHNEYFTNIYDYLFSFALLHKNFSYNKIYGKITFFCKVFFKSYEHEMYHKC